jgi:hypothetical protein
MIHWSGSLWIAVALIHANNNCHPFLNAKCSHDVNCNWHMVILLSDTSLHLYELHIRRYNLIMVGRYYFAMIKVLKITCRDILYSVLGNK